MTSGLEIIAAMLSGNFLRVKRQDVANGHVYTEGGWKYYAPGVRISFVICAVHEVGSLRPSVRPEASPLILANTFLQ